MCVCTKRLYLHIKSINIAWIDVHGLWVIMVYQPKKATTEIQVQFCRAWLVPAYSSGDIDVNSRCIYLAILPKKKNSLWLYLLRVMVPQLSNCTCMAETTRDYLRDYYRFWQCWYFLKTQLALVNLLTDFINHDQSLQTEISIVKHDNDEFTSSRKIIVRDKFTMYVVGRPNSGHTEVQIHFIYSSKSFSPMTHVVLCCSPFYS